MGEQMAVDRIAARSGFVGEDQGSLQSTELAHHPIQPGQLDPEHLAIQIQPCGKRLVLRRRSDVAFGRQTAQECFDLGRPQLARTPLSIGEYEPPAPKQQSIPFAQSAMVEM